MPIIFQQQLSESASIAVWKIIEPLSYFEQHIPAARSITHEEVLKRHLAARMALLQLDSTLSMPALKVAASGKPYFEDGNPFISFSHTEGYAAAMLSKHSEVGVDIERVGERITRIRHKFLNEQEQERLQLATGLASLQDQADSAIWLTRCWSAKESLFKWQGIAAVDFREHLLLKDINLAAQQLVFDCVKVEQTVKVQYATCENHVLTWTVA
jgi:phosphopantetheinyl transferase